MLENVEPPKLILESKRPVRYVLPAPSTVMLGLPPPPVVLLPKLLDQRCWPLEVKLATKTADAPLQDSTAPPM